VDRASEGGRCAVAGQVSERHLSECVKRKLSERIKPPKHLMGELEPEVVQ